MTSGISVRRSSTARPSSSGSARSNSRTLRRSCRTRQIPPRVIASRPQFSHECFRTRDRHCSSSGDLQSINALPPATEAESSAFPQTCRTPNGSSPAASIPRSLSSRYTYHSRCTECLTRERVDATCHHIRPSASLHRLLFTGDRKCTPKISSSLGSRSADVTIGLPKHNSTPQAVDARRVTENAHLFVNPSNVRLCCPSLVHVAPPTPQTAAGRPPAPT
jgi:hypothetical protein